MTLLTKKQFLDADDKQYKIVELPELKGSVRIRSMSGKDELKFEEVKKNKEASEWIFWAIAQYCVDEKGEQMFDESDVEAIKEKSSSSIKRIFDAILELNTISDEKVEIEAKNS
jgi:hypothetical protein